MNVNRIPRGGLFTAGLLISVVFAIRGNYLHLNYSQPPVHVNRSPAPEVPSPLATWPWPHAVKNTPHKGVTHWLDASSSDGVTVDLFDFDFGASPRLRLELYDQDEDDIKPFDNRVEYWSTGVGQATHHLNLQRRGPVVAAWNGLFFDLNGQGPGAIAGHLTPVVLGGHIHYAGVGNHRWTFGVKFSHGGPEFKALYHPTSVQTAHEFDFAAGAAQCLIHEGKPLKITPPPGVPPRVSGSALRIRAAETANDAGYIPIVDFIKVSRVSMGWSKDTTHLYLLYVNSPATETENSLKFKHGEAVSNGWNLADLQRFWIAKGAWGAINSDGGGPAQLTYLLPDGRYVLLPPKWASNGNRRVIPADFQGAPEGGSLMYFYIRENGG